MTVTGPMSRVLVPAVLLSFAAIATGASPSLYVEDLTWMEVRDQIASGKTTAIVYSGSIEQNGPHMALGKHLFLAHYIAGKIAEELGDALVYPTIPFAPTGDAVQKTGHMKYEGSVTLSSEVYLGVARQVALSAIAAGFKEIYLMGDHGGGQAELALASKGLDEEWAEKGVHVRYVPDLYYKEKEQMRKYLTDKGIAIDRHAGTDDTSEVLFIDEAHRWIRKDKLAASDASTRSATGVDGDPTKASVELGKMFVGFKIEDAVAQIRQLRAASN
jgi:creatinine amidohydrolase